MCGWARASLVAWTCLLLGLFLFGCPKRAERDSAELRSAFEAGDSAFQNPLDRSGVEQALEAWGDALSFAPHEPRLSTRLARGHLARAMLVDLSQRDLDLRMARQRGMDCLGSDNSWVGRSQRPRPAELQAIRVEQVGCVTWANLAWARWLEHRGVTGAGIDLEPLEALARRAVELDPDYDRGRSRAVLGLVLSLSSRDEQGLEESARELLAAQRARPERHVVDLDLARRVYQPLGRQEEWQESLSRVLSGTDSSEPFEALENQWARAQAQDALLRGFVRPGEKNGSNSREVRESGD